MLVEVVEDQVVMQILEVVELVVDLELQTQVEEQVLVVQVAEVEVQD
jgi:hypothetical protein